MKVLVATNMFPTPTRPYLGIFVKEQVEALRALGVQVTVAAHVAEGNRPAAYWRGARTLSGMLKAGDFALVHAHHTYSVLLARWAMRRSGRRVPLLFSFHESEIFADRRAGGGDYGQDWLRRLKYAQWLKGRALRGADRVLPVEGRMVARVLGEAGAAEIEQTVLPMGIDLERFRPRERGEARAELGWPAEGPVVFFPCDPAKPEKRHDLARGGFEAWRGGLAAEARTRARLVVGGQVPYEQMPAALAASDVVLTPTDYEASPTVVKEALACERPVVSTDVGDVREHYGDLAGVAICEWSAESVAAGLERAMGVTGAFGGRERIEGLGFGNEATARRLVGIYEETLAGWG